MAKKTKKTNLLRTAAETGQLKWYVLGGVILVGGVGFGLWYANTKLKVAIRRKQIGKIEEKTLQEGTVENIAKKIALELEKSWYEWRNNAKVVEAIKQIESKEDYNKLIEIYKKLTGKVLNEELGNKLTSTELKQIEDIISLKAEKVDRTGKELNKPNYNQKAEEYAEEIYKAVSGLDIGGSSCNKVLSVFRKIPSLAFYEQMKSIYETKHGDLWEDLLDETNIKYGLVISEGFKSCVSVLENIVKNLK